ncbi:DUF4178 domain-containing protein [Jannaschia sp. S6380]|uniref:DUF4178 domain-containing protein n=1 Tax=Jannaschia sp. S6380 TaxID=2926408 RepID=UPI001FF15438|nr:DUF4178 domain-containing protein [Jannaschia sp. S6380]MCK0165978.1 DUF4178 domain-containing protein [Jannaschia sp. S6380]
MTDRSCPNCGAALPAILAHARMVNCAFCGSSIVLDDATLRLAGRAGEMLDAPELIELARPVRLPQGVFTARGHVRYDYGRGHWDEYHGDLDGDLVWVSVDEGDVVLQRPLADPPQGARTLFRLGATLRVMGLDYTCTEVATARAAAFRGQLPEAIVVGEAHLYANFAGPRGAILSGEAWTLPGGEEAIAWFHGHWIDPFAVRPA